MPGFNLHATAGSLARRAILCAGVALGFAAGLAAMAWYPRAQAETAAAAPTSQLALQIAGKAAAPLSISTDSIPPDYRVIGMIDLQAHSGYYVSRGDTMTVGDQTFLLAYEVTVFKDVDGTLKIARGDDAELSLVNLSSVEIISHIGPLLPVGTPPPPSAGAGQ